MIRAIGQNDVLEAILLMKQSNNQNNYKDIEYNESAWITFFCGLVNKQSKKDPNALVIGYYDNTLKGFLSASTYTSYYNNNIIMDVRDCIVDKSNKHNSKIVHELFTHMIDHTKEHGGKYWRADSVQEFDNALKYGKFLKKRFNGELHISVRGKI